MALRPQNVKKTVTCIPMAAAPVAIMNAAIARSMSPLSSTIVTLSGLEACRSANATAGSICAIVMTPSFLSGPHEFGDFKGILTIVSASFFCQDNNLDPTQHAGYSSRRTDDPSHLMLSMNSDLITEIKPSRSAPLFGFWYPACLCSDRAPPSLEGTVLSGLAIPVSRTLPRAVAAL